MSAKTFHLRPWSLLLALGAAAFGAACGEQPQESVENTAAAQRAAATPLDISLDQRSRPQVSPEQAALAPSPRAAVPVDLSRSAVPVAQGGNESVVVGTSAPNRFRLDAPAQAVAQENLPAGRQP